MEALKWANSARYGIYWIYYCLNFLDIFIMRSKKKFKKMNMEKNENEVYENQKLTYGVNIISDFSFYKISKAKTFFAIKQQ